MTDSCHLDPRVLNVVKEQKGKDLLPVELEISRLKRYYSFTCLLLYYNIPTKANLMENITWRAVLIGLILIPINSYWIVLIETVYYSAHSTTVGFFFNAIFTILVLIALNAPLKKLSSKLALKQGEFLTIYIMLCQASALVGHSTMQILAPSIEKFHLKFTLSSNFIEKYLDIGDFFMLQYKHET
jgi:hypothetical protein